MISDQDLYTLLLENEYVAKLELDEALSVAQSTDTSLYKVILAKDLLSDENLGKLVADKLGLPYINLAKITIPKETLTLAPESFAKQNLLISFERSEQLLKVATANPSNREPLNHFAKKINLPLQLFFTTERSVQDALALYKKELKKTIEQLLAEQVEAVGQSLAKDVPIAKIIDILIEYAYTSKASDIHIEPKREEALVRFRIDGVLHDVLTFSQEIHHQVIARIKVLAKLRTDEHLSAQDGKLRVALEQEDLDVRVSIVPIVNGEKVVMRLLSSSSRQFGLSDLGIKDEDLQKVREGASKPYGMILSTGPTGSGKTTSMYAILKILNKREKNIATIEDPVEYDIPDINQIQVNEKTNLTFAAGLRSILRQDPDIIYVGEIRDEETADIAINSAMTGHLVLSTLHTNDAATALPRMIDMGTEPFLVASTVNVIIAQRLVRLICDKCKVSYTEKMSNATKHFKKADILHIFGKNTALRMYHGKGCSVCHQTGYSGRVGIFEILVVSDPIRQLITQKADSKVITQQAVAEGMSTMVVDGLYKVQEGMTTLEEVLRVTKED